MKRARIINTVAGLILLGLGIYHFTTVSATNPAWRSGTIETTSAVLLLAAAYRLPRTAGAIIDVFLAAGIAVVGSYHFTHAGMRSGVTEWLLAACLAIAAAGLLRHRP